LLLLKNAEIDNSFDFHFFGLIKKVKTNIFQVNTVGAGEPETEPEPK
jgi:hypothetical protein